MYAVAWSEQVEQRYTRRPQVRSSRTLDAHARASPFSLEPSMPSSVQALVLCIDPIVNPNPELSWGERA